MVSSGTTFSTEVQGYGNNNPAASLMEDDNILSDSERSAISASISSMEGIRADLQNAFQTATPDQKADLGSQISMINGSISGLKSAIKTGSKSNIGASIASAAGVVNHTRELLREDTLQNWQSSQDGMTSQDLYYNPPMSNADRGFVSKSFARDFSWYGGLDESSKTWINNDIASTVARDPELRAGLTAARAVNENTTLSGMQQKNIDDNKASIAEAKAYAKSKGDTELLGAIATSEKLIASRGKANDYSFKAQWDEVMKDGIITPEERKGLIEFANKETARRKEDFSKIDQKVFGGFSSGEKKAIDALYAKQHGGENPTPEQLQQFVKDAKPDTKQINDALAVMNKHAPDGCTKEQRRAAFAMLNDDQKQAFLLATAQTKLQVAEIAYDIKNFLKELSPEQQKETIAVMQQMIKDGKKDEVIAMLEVANGDKALSPATIKMIQNSKGTEDLAKIFQEAQALAEGDRKSFKSFSKTVTPQQDNSYQERVFDFGNWIVRGFTEENVVQAEEVVEAVETAPISVGGGNKTLDDMLKANSFKPPAGMTTSEKLDSDKITFSVGVPTTLGNLGVTHDSSNNNTPAPIPQVIVNNANTTKQAAQR